MPRYFFHVRQGDTLFEDKEGGVFADVADASVVAAYDARTITEQQSLTGPISEQSIEIVDEYRDSIAVLPFSRLLN